jgi:hypothetical protein
VLPHGEGGIRASPRTRKAVLTGILARITVDFVCLWPIATDRILVADRRFRGITDMAGAAAGRTRTRMTQSGHERLRIVAPKVTP